MVLPVAYLAPISYYSVLFHSPEVVIDVHEHYIKQTLRNHCVIATGQGAQTLSVNVAKGNRPHTPITDIRLSSHANWMHQHLYSLATYYGNSPFFEYYIDELKALYPKADQPELPTLFEFTESLRKKICELIGFEPQVRYSDEWLGGVSELSDNLTADLCGTPIPFQAQPYYQVAAIENKQQFMPNMSILDLLFNMGPESILVLRDSWKKN